MDSSMLRFVKLTFEPLDSALANIALTVIGFATAPILGVLTQRPLLGLAFGLAFLSTLLLWAGLKLQREKDDGPRLRFTWVGGKKARIVLRRMVQDVQNGELHEYMADVQTAARLAYVRVANVSRSRSPEHRVTNAVVRLDYEAFDGSQRLEGVRGRWADNAQVMTRKPGEATDDLLRRDLLGNGEEHAIDIAVRSEGYEEWYAAGHEYWGTTLQPEHLRLTARAYKVRIAISGERLRADKVAVFRVSDDGPTNDFVIEHMPNEG